MKKLKTIFKASIFFMQHAPLYCFIHIFSTIIAATKVYVLALFNKALINELVFQLQSDNFKEGILLIIEIILFLFFVEFIYNLISSISKYYMSKCAMKYQDKLRLSFSHKISAVDISFFDSPSQADEMVQAGKDMASIEALFKNIVAFFTASISTVVSIIIIAKLDWLLTIAIIISLIPSFILKKKIQKDSYEQEKALNLTNRKINYFLGMFNNKTVAPEMRLFNFAQNINSKLNELFSYRNNEKLKLARKNVALELFTLLISGVLNIACHTYIICIVLLNGLTIGDYNYYSTIAGNFKGNIEIILNNCSTIIINAEKIDSYFSFMNKPAEIQDGHMDIDINAPHVIEFINVSFTYPNAPEETIKNLSFSFSTGEKIALAGLNGSGKSTIIKLLLRFYDPIGGEIQCDGINIKKYRIDQYRSMFSATFQNCVAYSLSLRENISISNSNEEADDYAIIQALHSSGLYAEEENLDQQIGKQFDKDGIVLSVGQAQSMCIARSLYRKSVISIFDEPAASLDASIEQQLFERIFSSATAEKSIILISHRLSNLKQVDKIIFLENGKAIEIGSHNELLELKGKYYKLYRLQADRY